MSVHKNENWIALLFNYKYHSCTFYFSGPYVPAEEVRLGDFISEPLALETKDKCFGLIRHLMINIESWLLIDV